MKKTLLLVFAITMSIAANAQIFKSGNHDGINPFYVRAGVNINYVTYNDDPGVGYEFLLGYRHDIGTRGAHFNAELGMNTRGWGDSNEMIHQLFISPKFGWYASANSNLKFDPHMGLFAGYDLTASGDYDINDLKERNQYSRFDYGFSGGFGIWINNRWNFDVV
jgi:hypothetical protein